jgi:hypothetical protein
MSTFSDVCAVLNAAGEPLNLQQIAIRLSEAYPTYYGTAIDEIKQKIRSASLYRPGRQHVFVRHDTMRPVRYSMRGGVTVQTERATPQIVAAPAATPADHPRELLANIVNTEWFANASAAEWLRCLPSASRQELRNRLIGFADRVFEENIA